MSDTIARSPPGMTGKKQQAISGHPLPPLPSLQPIVAATAAAPHHSPTLCSQGTRPRETHGPCLRGLPPHCHVAVAIIMSSFHMEGSPAPTLCFSTYPALNAIYCTPPLCRACAPYMPSVLPGMIVQPQSVGLLSWVCPILLTPALWSSRSPGCPFFAKCIAYALLLRSLTPNLA